VNPGAIDLVRGQLSRHVFGEEIPAKGETPPGR
jgi:hypothetical protein